MVWRNHSGITGLDTALFVLALAALATVGGVISGILGGSPSEPASAFEAPLSSEPTNTPTPTRIPDWVLWTPAPQPTSTPAPTATPLVVPDVVLPPTATPIIFPTPLPTATPAPTSTPQPTATPAPASTPQPTATPQPIPVAIQGGRGPQGLQGPRGQVGQVGIIEELVSVSEVAPPVTSGQPPEWTEAYANCPPGMAPIKSASTVALVWISGQPDTHPDTDIERLGWDWHGDTLHGWAKQKPGLPEGIVWTIEVWITCR